MSGANDGRKTQVELMDLRQNEARHVTTVVISCGLEHGEAAVREQMRGHGGRSSPNGSQQEHVEGALAEPGGKAASRAA